MIRKLQSYETPQHADHGCQGHYFCRQQKLQYRYTCTAGLSERHREGLKSFSRSRHAERHWPGICEFHPRCSLKELIAAMGAHKDRRRNQRMLQDRSADRASCLLEKGIWVGLSEGGQLLARLRVRPEGDTCRAKAIAAWQSTAQAWCGRRRMWAKIYHSFLLF